MELNKQDRDLERPVDPIVCPLTEWVADQFHEMERCDSSGLAATFFSALEAAALLAHSCSAIG